MMRALLAVALGAGAASCSLIFDGNDLRGKNGDGGVPGDGSIGDGNVPLGDGGMPTAITFNPTTATVNTGGVASVAVADLNGDGHLDLIMVSSQENKVAVMLGHGDGTFSSLNPTFDVCATPSNSPSGVAVADLNKDAKPEIIVGCSPSTTSDGAITILANTSASTGAGTTPTFTAATQTVGFQVGGVNAADLDGDGNMDLVLTARTTPPTLASTSAWVSVLYGAGTVTFGAPTNYDAFDDPGGTSVAQIVVGDFDEDGKVDDLAVVIDGGNNIQIMLSTGARAMLLAPAHDLTLQTNQVSAVVAGNFNGDRAKPDDFAYVENAFFNPPYTITPLINAFSGSMLPTADGGTVFGSTSNTYNTDVNPIETAAADFNHDGKLDLVVGCLDPGANDTNVDVFVNTGSGAFAQKLALPAITGYSGNSIAVGDVNGDGLDDIILASSNEPTVQILVNTSH
ncbi:MAG TPA: VCBS repeat-containing protein [Polyangia bacterium]|nr:VCBS repeat-containing protein [Polyangia bacterium]